MRTAVGRVAVLAGVIVGLSGCGSSDPDRAPRATGYVEATEVRIASRVPGRVAEVAVTEGERVAAGALVAQVSTTELDLAIRRAAAERQQAAAQLRLLQRGARDEDIAQAEAQRAAAEAERDAAEAERSAAAADEARFDQLLARSAGSVKQRDDAAARRQLAEARVEAADERGRAAEAALNRLRAGTRVEEIDAARARVAAVDAQIAALEHDREDARITAPADGVVTARLVEPGELVGAGSPVALVVDLDRAWINAYVDEPLIPTLRIGQQTTARTDAGDTLTATVAFVAPRAEFTPRNVQTAAERSRLVYRVRLNVDNREGILKPGMSVDVTWTRPE